MSKGQEHVQIVGSRAIITLGQRVDQVDSRVTGDFRLLVEFHLKVDGPRLAQRLQVKGLFFTRRLITRHGLVCLQVVLDVLGPLDRPRCFGSEGECSLGFGGVKAWVALTDEQADSGNVDVGSLGPACIILILEPGIEDCKRVTWSVTILAFACNDSQLTRLLQLDKVRKVEWQIVSARDEIQPLVLAPGFHVSDDIASQMQQDSTQVGYTQQGDLDRAQVVHP